MSILWLEPFIFDPTDSNVFTFQSTNIVIYINMVSIICFVIYCMIYKMDINMQRPPNTLIIWKMFGEALISLHLLVLFLCFAIENNKRKMDLTKFIMWIVSLISPTALFITYFFAGCIAQNLYSTFYTYKNDFDKRMKKYKVYAAVGGAIVFLSSIACNSHNVTNTSSVFSIQYYPPYYMAIIYLAGGIGMVWIIIKTLFVVRKKSSFFSFLSQNSGNETDAQNQKIVSLFIQRHLMFCYIFIISFLPNGFILVLQIFLSYKICNDCRIFAFTIYLISSASIVSFVIKMTEPYMKKYFQVLFVFIMRKDAIITSSEDYSTIYKEEGSEEALIESTEMKVITSDEAKLNSMADTVEIVTREMQTNDFYKSLITIYLSINDDGDYATDNIIKAGKGTYLPWDDSYYNEKSKLTHYTNKNIQDSFKTLEELNDAKFLNVKIRKYAPRVFHHLRMIDGIHCKDFLESLNPKQNLKIIKASFASGGRSSNPIIFTYDKKLLLKTISKHEKDILINILPEFHRRMRDCKSLLCRIYGVYRIEVVGKQCIHIIVMRNMNELPSDTKVLCFDLKGSSVDRGVILPADKKEIVNGHKDDIIAKYKKTILKDLDFDELGFAFNFYKAICDELQKNLCEDSDFLRGNNLIDYSLLCSIHQYRKEDENKVQDYQSHRIIKTKDGKFLFNLSIIDFLTEYGLTKKFELGFKTANAMVSEKKDTNFSVQSATIYSRRFIRYMNMHLVHD